MNDEKRRLINLREELVNAAEESIKDFIKVAKEKISFEIPSTSDDNDSVDDASVKLEKVQAILKAKKMALVDGLEMIGIISAENEKIKQDNEASINSSQGGFAERRKRA